jgi:hypothetical protein
LSAFALPPKRPADRLDYDVDFADWLTDDDAIATVDPASVDADSGAASDEQTNTAQAVKVWLAGGTDGKTATVTLKITSALGREKEVCFSVRIRENC